MVTTRPPKTIVKPTALGPVANTDTKLLIYGLFQKGRVLAQDGVEDRIYNIKGFDRTLALDERSKLVARKVTAFLKESGDRLQKAIVFCVDRCFRN